MARGSDLLDELIESQTDECIIWPLATAGKGYGYVYDPARKKRIGAHVLAWERANGRVVPRFGPIALYVVMHSCDVMRCINPRHLTLGTYTDNNREMFAKGRGSPPPQRVQEGERNNSAKLTEADVREIRRAEGSNSEVGKRFGISAANVSLIRNRKRWKNV